MSARLEDPDGRCSTRSERLGRQRDEETYHVSSSSSIKVSCGAMMSVPGDETEGRGSEQVAAW